MPLRESCLAFILSLASGEALGLAFTGGVDDGFGGGVEPAAPSAPLLGSYGGPVIDFDVASIDEPLLHTFAGLPANLASGTLTFRVRGVSSGADTDGLALSFVTDGTATFADEVVYARNFGTFAGGGGVFQDPDDGLLTPGVPWGIGSEVLITLDLGALPLAPGGTVDLLPAIGAAGFLDVLLGDDSMVDFVELNLVAVPLPAGLVLLISGVAALRLPRSPVGRLFRRIR